MAACVCVWCCCSTRLLLLLLLFAIDTERMHAFAHLALIVAKMRHKIRLFKCICQHVLLKLLASIGTITHTQNVVYVISYAIKCIQKWAALHFSFISAWICAFVQNLAISCTCQKFNNLLGYYHIFYLCVARARENDIQFWFVKIWESVFYFHY